VKPRAIVGLGVASPLGIGARPFFDLVAPRERGTADDVLPARPPPGPPTTFDGAKYPGARVAEIPAFEPAKYLGDKGLRTLDRLSKILIVSARLALEDAGLKSGGVWKDAQGGERPWPERVGLVVSNAYGSLEAITELDRVALLEHARYINPSRFPLTVSNSAAGYVGIWEDMRALNVTVSDGNCGALDAVSCADLLLDAGRADVLLVGGAEAMTEALYVAFHRVRLGPEGRDGADGRPFLGEGGVLLALERAEHARARGAAILGEVRGYGTAFAAPEGEGALMVATPDAIERAAVAALADAGIAAADVDLVVSGLSGIRAFDDAELAAIQRVLGDGAPVVAPKRLVGETMGAGGAMGMLAALAFFDRTGRGAASAVPLGSIGVRGTLRAPVRTALVTSSGYYGNASALVMGAALR
jgi:3-oxoacyl-(acyl-carrier-protein) synthase